jgi:hypothetical protein
MMHCHCIASHVLRRTPAYRPLPFKCLYVCDKTFGGEKRNDSGAEEVIYIDKGLSKG